MWVGVRGTRRGQGRRARNVDQRPPFSIRPHVIPAFPSGYTLFRLSHQATRSGFPIRLHVVPAFPPGYTFQLSHQATRCSGFPTRLHVVLAFLPGYTSFRLSYQATGRSGSPTRLQVVPASLTVYTFRLSYQTTRSGSSHQATRSGFLTRLHFPAFLPGYTSFRPLLSRGWKSKDNVMTTFREQVLHIAKNDTGNWFTQHLKMMTPVGL